MPSSRNVPRPINATTLGADSGPSSRDRSESAEVLAFVIAWSAHEPERVGEIAVLPANGAPQELGRGTSEDGASRLRFYRQRAGRVDATPPLASPGLSRRQLVVRRDGARATVESVGRNKMRVNGAACTQATLDAGDVLYLRKELVLYCARRPALIVASRHFPETAVRGFGEPDATGLVGETASWWALRDRIAFAAKAATHVLVTGESGTGKELVARAVHALSSRSARPFVARNAATLPAGLIDAELFGNARNYPNPGMAERAGLVGEADEGVLFLDEVGELPTELQAHLLRVLDAHGEYQRLGEGKTRRSDFLLVAATNRDRTALKHDLLARLTTRIDLAPLSERREDIPLLVRHLLLRAAARSPDIAGRFVRRRDDGFEWASVTPALVEHVLRRDYTTHTRELDALLWQAMAESHDDDVDLPESLREPSPPPAAPETPPRAEPSADEIRAAMLSANDNVAAAAKALGLSTRFALYRLLKKHGITTD